MPREKRRREKERYAQMTNEKKQEKLKRRRETYQQKKAAKDLTQLKEKCKQGRKQYTDMPPEVKKRKCYRERQKYANMHQEQKKARIEQITANQELTRITANKYSIAMENPAYSATDLEVSVSTFNVKHRKHVTLGEKQTLLHRRKEETVSLPTSEEDQSMMVNRNNDMEHLKQHGNNLNLHIIIIHSKKIIHSYVKLTTFLDRYPLQNMSNYQRQIILQ